ncbi:hypothetical protein [Roseomonas rosulenta]|uniref:hypothetical protein n=1 Tax=Roseomonas rosulenta TaxID=2748667 RepID=UPI0018DF9712|nr:hypothetical protein [Roseomonas rosulenta]
MVNIDPPRTAAVAAGVQPGQDRQPVEPATGRALWPTFMRRTLDEHLVANGAPETQRGA